MPRECVGKCELTPAQLSKACGDASDDRTREIAEYLRSMNAPWYAQLVEAEFLNDADAAEAVAEAHRVGAFTMVSDE